MNHQRALRTVCLALSALLFAACAADVETDAAKSSTESSVAETRGSLVRGAVDTTGLVSVAELAKKVGLDTALGDRAALENYRALEGLIASGAHERLALGVYSLQSVASDPLSAAAARAKTLGLRGEPVKRGRYAVVSDPSGLELRLNADSGSEFMQDLSLFHASPGESLVPDDLRFVTAARKYAQSVLAAQVVGMPNYLYKVRHYVNGEAPEAQSGAKITTYQVAVALGTTIDDLPVIGAGGKVAVHFGPTGKVIGYEAGLRPLSKLVDVIPGKELIPPSVARSAIEKQLSGRGVDLTRYRLTRAEFGYARLGRDSAQNVVAPHYGYVWEPREGDGSKKLVELVPAFTSANALALVERDAALDNKRKAARMGASGALTER
ncbi:MAG TPA: hypothetical protein VER11_32470 [Polyangiaceae bacterium]|nr:hypothetical protein [Polyangiaceae bacterium]